MNHDELLKVIKTRLRELEMSEAEASRRAVGNPYLISNLRRGRSKMPSAQNLGALCEVLHLDFRVGSPGGNLTKPPSKVRISVSSGDFDAEELEALLIESETVIERLRTFRARYLDLAALVWEKANLAPGEDPNAARLDDFGHIIFRSDYGKTGTGGWKVGYVVSPDEGGTDDLSNFRAAHWDSDGEKARLREWREKELWKEQGLADD